MQLFVDPLVRKYPFLPFAKYSKIGIVRNVLERRLSDVLSHMLGPEPRLSVTNDSVEDFDEVHFGLESNKLYDRLAFRLVL